MPFPIATLFADTYSDALEHPPRTVRPQRVVLGLRQSGAPSAPPDGSRCALCGDPLADEGFPVKMDPKMTDFAGFRGLVDQADRRPVAWCCRPCTIFQMLFWRSDGKDDAVPEDDSSDSQPEEDENKGEAESHARSKESGPQSLVLREHGRPPFSLACGWNRFPSPPDDGIGPPGFERRSLEALRVDPQAWASLERALRDPEAHTLALVLRATNRRVAPWLAYTPARARHLHILFFSGGAYPVVSSVARDALWRLLALVGRDVRDQAEAAVARKKKPPDDALEKERHRLATQWRTGKRAPHMVAALRQEGLPDPQDLIWRWLIRTLVPDAPLPAHWTPDFPGFIYEGVMVS